MYVCMQQVVRVLGHLRVFFSRLPNTTDLPSARMTCCANSHIAHYCVVVSNYYYYYCICYSYGVTDIIQLFYYQFKKFSIEQKMFSVESAPVEVLY